MPKTREDFKRAKMGRYCVLRRCWQDIRDIGGRDIAPIFSMAPMTIALAWRVIYGFPIEMPIAAFISYK